MEKYLLTGATGYIAFRGSGGAGALYRKKEVIVPMMKLNNKKLFLILGVCVFLLGIAAFAITRSNKFFGDRTGTEDSTLSNDNLFPSYWDYAADVMTYVLEKNDKIADCEIDISYLNEEILSVTAEIILAAQNKENEIQSDKIANYISQTLDIPTEKIAISIH